MATLDSALATESPEMREIRSSICARSELLSGIPWLNDRLLKFQLAPQLQDLLHQADLKWTAGGLLADVRSLLR